MKPFKLRMLFAVVGTAVLASVTGCGTSAQFIYGVSPTEKALVVARFDPARGELSKIQRLPLEFTVEAVAYSAKHKLVYVASYADAKNGKPNGAIFSAGADGRLTPKAPFTFAHGYSFFGWDRSKTFLMGASYFGGAVGVYRLDKAGMPVKVAGRREGSDKAHAVLTSPDNRFAYVPYVKDQNALYQYGFDAKTGKLTPLDPAKAKVGVKAGPRHMAFHPTRPFVYFSNEQQLGVSAYKIDTAGRLTLLQVCSANGIEPEKGLDASGIAITPDGKFVFAAVRGFGRPVDLIVHYQVLSDGQLKPIGQTPTGSIPWVISLDTTGKYLLVSAAKGGTLTAYRITSTGSLEKGASIVWGQQYRDMTVR